MEQRGTTENIEAFQKIIPVKAVDFQCVKRIFFVPPIFAKLMHLLC